MYPVPLQRKELRLTSLRIVPEPVGLCKRRASDLPQNTPDLGAASGAPSRPRTLEGKCKRSRPGESFEEKLGGRSHGGVNDKVWVQSANKMRNPNREVWGSGMLRSRSRRRTGLEDSRRPDPTFPSAPAHCWLDSQFPL